MSMQPIDPRAACAQVPDVTDPDCSIAGSQAALMLAARVGVLGVRAQEEADLEAAAVRGRFELPDLRLLRRERLIGGEEALALVGGSRQTLTEAADPQLAALMSVAAQQLYRSPTPEHAAALFEVGLHSPHPLVRVAAAAGASQATEPRPLVLDTLRTGAEAPDSLVATLAATALAQVGEPQVSATATDVDRGLSGPSDESGADVQERGSGSSTATDATTAEATPGGAVITHGTWGAEGTWYRPGGDFWTRLSAERPDLRVHDPSFTWSGAYDDGRRRQAAAELVAWCAAQGLTLPDLFAHSHGSTVGNLATNVGLSLGRLVYMAWPVHAEWFPDPARVRRVIDIRVNMDLVILVDRGGQRIRNAPFPVEEHVNGWFDHTSTHEPAYWDEHGLWSVV